MTTPIDSWIMAAATRLVDEWHQLEQEALQTARAGNNVITTRLHLIESVSHVIWVEKQREVPR